MWSLKDKYKGCCHNDACESFDTCVECWDEWAGYNPPMTNADRIRAMSDEELAEFLCGVYDDDTCGVYGAESGKFINGITIMDYDEFKIVEWLRQPADPYLFHEPTKMVEEDA